MTDAPIQHRRPGSQGVVTVHEASKPALKRLFTAAYETGLLTGPELRQMIRRHGLESA